MSGLHACVRKFRFTTEALNATDVEPKPVRRVEKPRAHKRESNTFWKVCPLNEIGNSGGKHDGSAVHIVRESYVTFSRTRCANDA